jgi:hypothetical protein
MNRYSFQQKKLETLTQDEYEALRSMGFLYQFFPLASGNWEIDTNQKET